MSTKHYVRQRSPLVREDGSRRVELLNAAAKLFREKGFAATTIRDIAGAVGMGSGSPFCHFRSKQHILDSIAIEGMEAALNSAQALVARKMSPADRFHALLHLHLETLHSPDNDFVAVTLHEWRALSPENRDRLVALMDRYELVWHGCLRRLRRVGLLRGDINLARKLILGAANWSLHWFRAEGAWSPEQLAVATTELLTSLAGLAPAIANGTGELSQPQTL